MRLVRLFVLTLILAAVYFAQFLRHATSLDDLLPAWLLNRAPTLIGALRGLPVDWGSVAQWLTLIGLLSFGLIAPWWQGERGRAYRRLPPGKMELRRWWWAAQAALLPALVGAGVLLMGLNRPALERGVWAATLAVYLLAGGLASRVRRPVVYGGDPAERVQPWAGQMWLWLLLVIFGGLYLVRLTTLPLRVDALTAQVTLAAQRWAGSDWPALAASPAAYPLPTLLLSTLLQLLTDDNLVAARLTGLVAALGLLSGVWLVACELFRRTPLYGAFGEVLEDDGRGLALLTVLALGVLLPMLHWARVPGALEGVVWSTWALWALLRGLRTDRPWLLGVSAVAFGWAVYYGAVGLLMLPVALLVWGGVWLVQREWLTGKLLPGRAGQPAVRVQRGVGGRGFGYWLAGIVVTLAPLLNLWWRVPGAWAAQWRWPTGSPDGLLAEPGWGRVQLTLAGLNWLPDAAGFVPYATPFVPMILFPLAAIALGALLLNLDSVMGWTLIAWLGVGIVGVALTTSIQPNWLALALLLPPIALALAFVLDRLRLLIMQTAGTWTLQATVYLAVGVLVAAGFWGWVEFYGAGQRNVDLASAVGRVLRESGDVQVVVVGGSAELAQLLDDPVVQMLAGGSDNLTHVQSLAPVSWPPLPVGTRLLVAADGSTLPAALDAAYPGGQMTILRDLRANPVLYVYDLDAMHVQGNPRQDALP